jgi:hypothetical protein
MRLMVWKLAGLAALVVAALGVVGTAHASHLNVRVSEPTAAVAGQPSELDAAVTSADTRQAVAGVPVTFYVHGSFGKVSGFMEIGHGVTNAQGIATVSYVPREGGAHEVRVDYATPAGGTTEQTTGTVAVDGSPNQLYVQTAGVQVPGLNSWLIIVVLTLVWGILFGVGLMVIRIAATRSAGRAVATRPLAVSEASEAVMRSGTIGTR